LTSEAEKAQAAISADPVASAA